MHTARLCNHQSSLKSRFFSLSPLKNTRAALYSLGLVHGETKLAIDEARGVIFGTPDMRGPPNSSAMTFCDPLSSPVKRPNEHLKPAVQERTQVRPEENNGFGSASGGAPFLGQPHSRLC